MVPLAHEMQHMLYLLDSGEKTENIEHDHPDFDALSDDSPHQQETDLSCVLCSFWIAGITIHQENNSIPDISSLLNHSSGYRSLARTLAVSIRGPPSANDTNLLRSLRLPYGERRIWQ